MNKLRNEVLHSAIQKLQADEIRKIAIDVVSHITPRARLRNFEVHLVEHCNLKCQCCNHYAPIAEERFLDMETFEKDFERMSLLTGANVEFIRLLGGEPLLHPNLLQFFPIARRLFPNRYWINVEKATTGLPVSIWAGKNYFPKMSPCIPKKLIRRMA
ncbi:MAG: hypothetical protein LBI05_09715 [Planctomycetaceae bacterium]|nr:hypothetical protein [Planctomycetaceae bacterium]